MTARGDTRLNTTAYEHPQESNLLNIHKAMEYDEAGKPHVRVGLGSDNITITGNVNLVDTVSVNSTPEDPVHIHITEIGTSGLLAVPYMPIQGTVSIGSNGTVSLSANTLSALENITVSGSVSVGNFPASQAVTGTFWQTTQPVSIASMPSTPVTGTFWQTTQPVSGTVTVQDGGGSITVDGNVTATITDVITVVVNEDAGALYAFNNHAANTNRGWTMDNTMRPVISIRNGSASALDLIKIVEYEIGNNNANQSTIVYEWYEGPLTIAGAAIPAWTTFGVHSQYRVYQDQYSSNQGNTFTVPAGTYMRHSGIIIGKNTLGDRGPASMHGGATDADKNMVTLCMKRVDNATKLDVWFAFTIRELT
jgi:hypothetical protein